MKKPLTFLLISLTVLILAALVIGIEVVLARQKPAPAAIASPLHPPFAILDAEGINVLESGKPASTMQTCGQCHDTQFIESHSYHADLGLRDYQPRPDSCNSSNGLFGKFDPITYRYLSAEGDERLDLTTPDWLKIYGWRVPGGGPAVYRRDGRPLVSSEPNASDPEASTYDPESGTYRPWDWSQSGVIEMNCFLCHTSNPNNAARLEMIQSGQFGWANTATLLGSGIVERTSQGFVWNRQAFDEEGKLKQEYVQLRDPTNQNCAACHGVVYEDPITPLTLTACDPTQTQTATTGQVIASQKISESGLNIQNKAALNRAWDIHAERALKCTDCHFSLNNPIHLLDEKRASPSHLLYDPRKLTIGEYLQKPDHNFARGSSAQFTVAPELKGTMRRCDSCHDTNKSHAGWLPYNDRHMQVLACESCHIPVLTAPAYQSVDWTVLRPDRSARVECRGLEGDDPITDLVTGYRPVLMKRTESGEIKTRLAPYNLVTAFFWVYEDARGNVRPVRKADLEAAYFDAADVLTAFDADQDGHLSDAELVLDTPAKQELIAGKLTALGLKNVRLYGQVQPYSINHNVVDSRFATRDCTTCHRSDSRVTQPILLARQVPLGVTPEFVSDTNVASSGAITSGSSLYYYPVTKEDRVYLFGYSRIPLIDWFGLFLVLGTVAGVSVHGGLRYLAARRLPKPQRPTRLIYMYEVYERFWHWIQAFAIGLLLVTGLVIHRPDLFGAFSFRHMVTIHNVVAALLAINTVISLIWHLLSGEIQQYVPHPYGFIDQMIAQAMYYLRGIFRHEPHPFLKSKKRKFNPLQMITYIGLLGFLLPLQGLTGIMMWLVQKVPAIQHWFGGLTVLAPIHTMNAWLFMAFVIAHVYLTTTAGPKPLDAIQAMITGWEEMEVHENNHHHSSSTPEKESQA